MMVRDRGDGAVDVSLCRVHEPRLEIWVGSGGPSSGIERVSFSGTLCLETTTKAQKVVERWLVEQGVVGVDVDLSDVDFIDARGVSLLLGMRERCEQNRRRHGSSSDVAPHVGAASACVRYLLEICEVEEILGVRPLHGVAG